MSNEANQQKQDESAEANPEDVVDELEFVTEETDDPKTDSGGEPSSEEPEGRGGGTPQTEVEKWKEMAARSQAELENFRKRMAREKSEAILYANRSLLEQLLPIIDNFEMGLKAASDSEGQSSMILQGMGMVRKQLEEFLSAQGVEVIDSDGVPFDPNVHEAIKQESSEEVDEGVVLYTVRRGYRLKERVIRAANVVVSSGPGGESEESS